MNYTHSYYSNFLGALIPFGLIPINEIYAWSNNQKIHILFHKINELVNTSNIYGEAIVDVLKWIEDNKEAIKDMLEEMYDNGELVPLIKQIFEENPDIFEDILEGNPELIATAVKNQLTEMLDNGSLNDVIKDVLLEVDDGKHSYLELSRKWRILPYAHNYNSHTYNEAIYSALQACCHFNYQGQGYIAMYLYCSNCSDAVYDDNGIIKIYREDGTFVIDKPVSWGHCNSFAFDEDNGYLYGAVSATYDNNPTAPTANKEPHYSRDLKRVRFTGSSLGLEETRTVPIGGNNPHINGVAWYKGQLYACQGLKIWKFDWDTATIINEMDINFSGYGTLAGWAFTDDYLYCGLYKPDAILRINRHTLQKDWVYYLKPVQNQGMFFLGEIEGISIDHNNNLWVFTFQRMQNLSNLTHHMAQVFVQNLDRQDILPTRVRTHIEDVDKIYVDVAEWGPYNPNGTAEYPFPCIQEALWFGENCEDIKNMRIEVKRDTGWYLTVSTKKPVWIEGVKGKGTGTAKALQNGNLVDITVPIIGGIDVQLCPYFRVSQCEIRNHHPNRYTAAKDKDDEYITQPPVQNITSVIYAVCGTVIVGGSCYLRNFNTYEVDDDPGEEVTDRYGVYGNGVFCSGVSTTLTYGDAITSHTHFVGGSFSNGF